MEECSSDYQRWTKLPVLKSGDDDGNATLFELRPSLSSVSHYTPSAWSVWLTNGSNWVSLCYYISNTLEGEQGTPQYFFFVLLLSLSHFQSQKKKMVGTDLRQQLNNYIQSMRDQVSSDQTQFFVLMR